MVKNILNLKNKNIENSKFGLCLRTDANRILNIQKIGNFLSLKFTEGLRQI